MIFKGKQLFDSSFDDFASNYNKIRPNYPKELFKKIKDDCLGSIEGKKELLEIGTGTGIATKDLINLGVAVTTIEPGKNLLEIAQKEIGNEGQITFINETFEAHRTSNKYDVVFSATTFHWLNKENKFEKAASLIKENGYLILVWNSFLRDDSSIFSDIDQLYLKHLNEVYANEDINHNALNKLMTREREISESGFFYITSSERYLSKYYFDGDSYAKLLNTFPKIIKLEKSKREAFLEDVKMCIDSKKEKVCVPVLSSLYICRKIKDINNLINDELT